jgi:hypothetical protein
MLTYAGNFRSCGAFQLDVTRASETFAACSFLHDQGIGGPVTSMKVQWAAKKWRIGVVAARAPHAQLEAPCQLQK